ncbi:hypothetical protein V1639_03490 [Pseudarthrobacter sp. J75]|uniref:hypothetical protein n=1 Tax=unclassified Pseudarthrobacter TaxID=2647000 RepID=UPI002E815F8E|nr:MULTISPECIES: hypothetical protein [unclassified Pseudarthrobacter]MEE2522261.1 hypothetical protein [Pseudarthrobacter sp. J47]MEE2528093.1 hypothetical protein [Pseudarthrobacter sp. J75]
MPSAMAGRTRAWRAATRPLEPPRAHHNRPAAVVLSLVLSGVLSLPALTACEYTYDDAWSPPEVESTTAPVVAEPPRRRGPPAVGVEDMRGWADEVMPGAAGETVHSSLARLEAGEVRTEETPSLEPGTYSLTLACRSVRRVDFLVRNGESALIDLRLLCGAARVNVIQLPEDAVLSLRVHADETANVAYRVIRL